MENGIFGQEKPRLLVIDRDPSIRNLLQLLLDDEYAIDQAMSGILAIQMLRHVSYDCVMASLEMPPRSGFSGSTIIQKLRAVPGCERLPVVAVAPEGQFDSDAVEKTLEAALLPRPRNRPFENGSVRLAIERAFGIHIPAFS